jgi:hypothetical protein
VIKWDWNPWFDIPASPLPQSHFSASLWWPTIYSFHILSHYWSIREAIFIPIARNPNIFIFIYINDLIVILIAMIVTNNRDHYCFRRIYRKNQRNTSTNHGICSSLGCFKSCLASRQVWVGPSGLVAFMVEIAGSLRAKRLQHREMKIQQFLGTKQVETWRIWRLGPGWPGIFERTKDRKPYDFWILIILSIWEFRWKPDPNLKW